MAISKLKDQIQAEKIACYETCKQYVYLHTESSITHCGFKDIGSALVAAVNQSADKIEKMIKAYERRFPQ